MQPQEDRLKSNERKDLSSGVGRFFNAPELSAAKFTLSFVVNTFDRKGAIKTVVRHRKHLQLKRLAGVKEESKNNDLHCC